MKFLVILLSIFFLVSCGENSSQNTNTASEKNIDSQKTSWDKEIEKTELGKINQTEWKNINQGNQWGAGRWSTTDFSINVVALWDFQNNYTIEKNWVILPNQSLTINPQVSWDVANIYVKEGDQVYAGQTIVSLKDSYSRYALDIEKSQIDYDKQIINKESQIISIDKNISDLERNLADAKRLYDNAVITAFQDTKSAEIAFENSRTLDSSSSAGLALEKAQLDYNNVINDNKQDLEWYITDAQKEYNNLSLNITDIIEFGDKLYGITDRNKDTSDDIESYFGALNTTQKSNTKVLLQELINYNEYLETLETQDISQDDILTFLTTYKDWYSQVTEFLNELEETMNNSITSIGSLSQSEIDAYVSQINSYQNSNQWDSSSYDSTYKSIDNFLASYENDELLALTNLETIQKNSENSEENGSISYNKTLISIDNTLNWALKNYESLQASYDLALADKEITIKSLDNSIQSARNTLTKSQVEYGKLSITAPISGVISNLDTSVGEYVWTNKWLVTLISDKATQIEIDLSKDEIQNILVWDEVVIIYSNQEYSGTIFSLWTLADEALNYNVTVTLNGDVPLIGGSAKVLFKNTEAVNVSIPFNLVDVSEDDTWTINTLNNGVLETVEVSLWKISGSNIDILNELPHDIQVITTSLKNYNPKLQTLSIK